MSVGVLSWRTVACVRTRTVCCHVQPNARTVGRSTRLLGSDHRPSQNIKRLLCALLNECYCQLACQSNSNFAYAVSWQLHGDYQSSQQCTDSTSWQKCAWLKAQHQTGKVRIKMARSRNHCCRVKPINITYSECVSVALGMQTAKRMRRIIFSSVACLALPYFPTLSHKRHDFREKVTEYKMCVLIFSTTFV